MLYISEGQQHPSTRQTQSGKTYLLY